MKINMKNLIIIPICTILFFMGSTYAYYKWGTISGEEVTIATDTGYAKVFYDAGPNVAGRKILPVLDKNSGISKEITIRTDREFIEEISFNLYLDINILDEGLKDESFKFELYKDDTLIKTGNFSNKYLNQNLFSCDKDNVTKHIVLIENDEVTTTESKYMLYIWIDGNMENPINMTNKNFDFTLHADGKHAILTSVIPAGGMYIRGAVPYDINNHDMTDAAIYTEGMDFPENVELGDIYRYGDYEYVYGYYYDYEYHVLGEDEPSWRKAINWQEQFNGDDNGWGVRVIDSSKDSYGNILETINGANIINLSSTFESTNITESPVIPSTVKFLRATFQNCQNLINPPEIPASVIKMNYTFSGCTSLIEVPAIPDLVVEMEHAFEGCISLTEPPVIPNSVTNMLGTFMGCENLQSAPVIPALVTNMAYTFSDCKSLVVPPAIPSYVTNMDGTFQGCTNLQSAPEIPNLVTTMYGTFRDCTSLISAPKIPDSVTELDWTFSGCTNLEDVPPLPNSLQDLQWTFEKCTSLVTAPAIPESVEFMNQTFLGCSKLTGIVRINSKKIENFWDVFNNTSEPITLEVPNHSITFDNISYNELPSNVTITLYD